MKKKSSLVSYFAAIVIFGVISSLFTSDIPFREIFDGLELNNIEVLLDTLNLWLGFLALGFLVIFIFYRSATGGKDQRLYPDMEQDWSPDPEE